MDSLSFTHEHETGVQASTLTSSSGLPCRRTPGIMPSWTRPMSAAISYIPCSRTEVSALVHPCSVHACSRSAVLRVTTVHLPARARLGKSTTIPLLYRRSRLRLLLDADRDRATRSHRVPQALHQVLFQRLAVLQIEPCVVHRWTKPCTCWTPAGRARSGVVSRQGCLCPRRQLVQQPPTLAPRIYPVMTTQEAWQPRPRPEWTSQRLLLPPRARLGC